MCVLACREELAEDLLDHREVVDVASRHGRQRFVEEQHALIDAVVVDEARAEIRERWRTRATSRHDWRAYARASSVVLLLDHSVRLEHALVERHPPGLRARTFVGEQRHRTRKPSLHHRPIADDRQVHVRQRSGDTDRAHTVCLAAVGLVRRAPQLDRQQILVIQIVGSRQTLESGAAFGAAPKRTRRPRRAVELSPRTQRGVSLIDQQLLGSAHSLESLRASPDRRDRPTCHCQMLTITVTTSRLTSAIDWAFLLELRSERTQSSAPIRLHRVGDDGIGEARVLDRHRALRIASWPTA